MQTRTGACPRAATKNISSVPVLTIWWIASAGICSVWLPPVMLVSNRSYYDNLTPEKVDQILDSLE